MEEDILNFINLHMPYKNNIYTKPNIPEKKIINVIKKYAKNTKKDDILILIDNTIFGSASESVIITNDYIISKEILEDPILIFCKDIKNINIVDNNICIDNKKIFILSGNDKEFIHSYMIFLIKLIDFIKENNTKKSVEEIETSANHQLIQTEQNEGSLPALQCDSIIQDTAQTVLLESSSNPFFKIIAKLGGYAVLIVVLLEHNAPDKVLALVSRLPVVGGAGLLGRFVLGKPLDWLNQQIILYGEPVIMQSLTYEWKISGISYEELCTTISESPDLIFEISEKEEALQLLQKYFPNEAELYNSQKVNEECRIEDSQNTEVAQEDISTSLTTVSMEKRMTILKELFSLYQSGVLSDEEFQAQKRKLLNE